MSKNPVIADMPARAASSAFYRATWRWHFYAGLYVVPFIVMLAITGLIQVYGNSIETPLGQKHFVSGTGEPQTVIAQAKAAETSITGGKVAMYVAPRTPERASIFMVNADGKQIAVAVDPYQSKVVGSVVKDDTWYSFANEIHGTFFMGDFGDRLIEIAAGFGIMLIVTGLYLWWPRDGKGLAGVLLPNLAARGRMFWKELHVSVGFYISVVLFFFLISGLSWAGIWGTKYTQAWSTFPAEKWDNVPLSDKNHASMNHGPLHEVPWALEQTKLPLSGSDVGVTGVPEGTAVNLNSVVALAKAIGFHDQFRVNLPGDEGGVYTISADSMDHDTELPWQDRTVHVDQYTGKILAQVGFADYSPMGKAMAVGIALHQGDMGLWNTILNTVFCLAIIFLAISGVIMWWLRRPVGESRLMPPPMPENLPLWRGAVFTMLALSLAFPMTGLALIAVLALDLLVLSRVPTLKFMFK
ncbi:MAG: PepSY domain-containing protein [Aestuariivirga sp.]